jgi:Major tropism determinant N-terminal domain
MAYRIQFRRDTSTNWDSNNPILLQGEFGYELDTGFAKIGDGSSTWDQLTYFGGTGPTGPIGVTGATGPSVSSIAPGSSGATGTIGDLALDTDYFYVCIGTNTWKRTQITGW